MAEMDIGERAPDFRLPSGRGGEVGLGDYRGRSSVIVWFTKGMACPFCRTQMSQLARGYPQITALGAEVLQVTPTTPGRARFFAKNFSIPFQYLCDPDYLVHRQWGVDVRSHSLAWYAKMFRAASKMETPPPTDIGNPKSTLRELPHMLTDSDMGFFVVDRDGIVRYKLSGSYLEGQASRQIPTMEEITRELVRWGSRSADSAAS
jgi:peroxiredoxin